MSDSTSPTIMREAERDPSIGGLVLAREGMYETVRALSRVEDSRFLVTLLRQWFVIAAAAGFAITMGHWLAYLLAMVVIATRQHALAVLMHDGTHYRLLANRAANDLVSDVCCAFPLGMTTNRYRYEHLLHHRFLNTDRDPYWLEYLKDSDWHWPKSAPEAIRIFLCDLVGWNLRAMLPVLLRWSPWPNHFSTRTTPPPLSVRERLSLYLFWLTVVTVLAVTGAGWYFAVLWLLPLSTFTQALMRYRTLGEHLAIPNRTELDASRHTDGTLLERWSIAPLNINYHIDHHLFPSVPFYNLPALHAALLKNETYRAHAVLRKTYLGWGEGSLLRDLILGLPAPVPSG